MTNKYFLTSDKKFIININEIVLITLNNIPNNAFQQKDNNTEIQFSTIEELNKKLDEFKLAYFTVYINGIENGLVLKYIDGVRLINEMFDNNELIKGAFINESISLDNIDTAALDNNGEVNVKVEQILGDIITFKYKKPQKENELQVEGN